MVNVDKNISALARVLPALVLIIAVGNATTLSAQTSRKPAKPTELVVKRYERLVADGSLLTPEGWMRASKLFDQPHAYPQNSEIMVISTGGLVGEDWVKGDQAEVETKWDDYYGKIDSQLRFIPDPYGPVMMGNRFSLVCQPLQGGSRIPDARCQGEWKIKGPHILRDATISAAIRYVTAMLEKSNDPSVKKNADATIAALKRLSGRCGAASAC